MNQLEITESDITALQVDAIVNAANAAHCGGGGVDGAIHRAAGPELLKECRTLGGCNPGFAKITSGYNLPARFVIHAVGPVWYGGHKGEEELLASCYRESMQLALEHDVESIAFPAISCGAYRFPISRACEISVSVVRKFMRESSRPAQVVFSCPDPVVIRHLRREVGKS